MVIEKNADSFVLEEEKNQQQEIVIEDFSSKDASMEKETAEVVEAPSVEVPVDEQAVSEEAPIEVETPVEEEPEPKYEDIVVLLKQYFNALRDSIRLAKTKDDTIVKMKNELTKYREDFGYSLLKQIISSLISLREDAKSTLRNIAKFSPDVETTKKYISYLDDDFVEILSNFGIEVDDGNYLLDGVNLNEIKMRKVTNYVAPESVEEVSEPVSSAAEEEKPVKSLSDVVRLVEENKANVEAILKDNSLLDEAFRDVEKVAASVDQNYADALLLPSYKKVTGFYTRLKRMIESTVSCLSEENKTALYSDVLVYVISCTSDLLSDFGVEINVDISNTYDMKTNRMLKFVPTDKVELDKTIAFRHTDTYLYNGKVIYLCKVDVYKYEQK